MHIAAATVLALSVLPSTLWFIEALTSTASSKRFPVGSTVYRENKLEATRKCKKMMSCESHLLASDTHFFCRCVKISKELSKPHPRGPGTTFTGGSFISMSVCQPPKGNFYQTHSELNGNISFPPSPTSWYLLFHFLS